MSNPWMDHVKKVRAKNPKMAYKDVLVKAKASYKKKDTSAPKKKMSVATKQRLAKEEEKK